MVRADESQHQGCARHLVQRVFGATGTLNAATWDPVRLRLVFADATSTASTSFYAIDMAELNFTADSMVNVASRLHQIGILNGGCQLSI